MSYSVGLDLRQDAPRYAELARADSTGIFQLVTLNNSTIGDIAPLRSSTAGGAGLQAGVEESIL